MNCPINLHCDDYERQGEVCINAHYCQNLARPVSLPYFYKVKKNSDGTEYGYLFVEKFKGDPQILQEIIEHGWASAVPVDGITCPISLRCSDYEKIVLSDDHSFFHLTQEGEICINNDSCKRLAEAFKIPYSYRIEKNADGTKYGCLEVGIFLACSPIIARILEEMTEYGWRFAVPADGSNVLEDI